MIYVLIDSQHHTYVYNIFLTFTLNIITKLYYSFNSSMWIYIVCFSSLSMGGIFNAARYVSNEGWWLTKEKPEVVPDGLSTSFRTDQMASNTTATTKSSQTDTSHTTITQEPELPN